MENKPSPPAARWLEARRIPFELFTHTMPVESLEQAAAQRGQAVEQVIRSILFRLEAGEYLLVLAPGGMQIGWGGLRRWLGRSRLTMAEPHEVLAVTGYPVGAVSPFGLANPLRTLALTQIFTPPVVSLGSGQRGVALVMTREALRQALAGVEEVTLDG